jgi:hypothetical protein
MMLKLALALSLLGSTIALADDFKPTPVPDGGLDRQAISDGMRKVSADVLECGKPRKDVKGVVKVSIEVAPSGAIVRSSIKVTPDPALGDCVLAAVRKATFATSKLGGSFSYPYVF